MKKVLLLIICLIFAIACSKVEQNESPNTIEFWHFWSEPYQKDIIDSLVKEFEKKNSCKVNVTLLSWADGKTKLLAAFNSGTAPDVLELGSDWVPQFSSAGVLCQIDNSSKYMSKFLEFSLEPAVWKKKLYALPWVVDTRVLFVNKDLIEKAKIQIHPDSTITYSQLFDYSSKTDFGNGIHGIGINGPDAHKLYKKILPMFWTYGGGIYDKKNKLIIDCPENIKALEMYCDLSRNGLIETQRELDSKFIQGKIAFCFSGSWMIDKIRAENPKLNYMTILMPKAKTQNGISFAGGEYLSICKSSKNIKLAHKFIDFISDGKTAISFCKRINVAGFPADKNSYNSREILTLANKDIFAKQLQYSQMTPMTPKWLDIEPIIEEAVVEALYGKKTATEALFEAKQKIIGL